MCLQSLWWYDAFCDTCSVLIGLLVHSAPRYTNSGWCVTVRCLLLTGKTCTCVTVVSSVVWTCQIGICSQQLPVLYAANTCQFCMFPTPACSVCSQHLPVLYAPNSCLFCMIPTPACSVWSQHLPVLYDPNHLAVLYVANRGLSSDKTHCATHCTVDVTSTGTNLHCIGYMCDTYTYFVHVTCVTYPCIVQVTCMTFVHLCCSVDMYWHIPALYRWHLWHSTPTLYRCHVWRMYTLKISVWLGMFILVIWNRTSRGIGPMVLSELTKCFDPI